MDTPLIINRGLYSGFLRVYYKIYKNQKINPSEKGMLRRSEW